MGLINRLGVGILGLGLVGSPNLASESLLESRVIAAEQAKDVKPEEYKENYTFDEVKTALGERYSKLSDSQKKTVEDSYKRGKEHIKFSYNTSIGLIYNKKNLDSLSKEDIEELTNFKISGLKQETLDEYLIAFPWIKKENLAEMDKNPRNPDKMLIYYTEFYKELDKDLSGISDSFEMIAILGAGLELTTDGLNYLSKCEMNPTVKKIISEAGSWYVNGPTRIYEKAKSFYKNIQKKEANKKFRGLY